MNVNSFYSIISDMWCCEANMPNKNDIVSDEIIKSKIDDLQVLNQKDRDGRNLLMFAAIYQRPMIVEYLLEKGFNVNEQDKNGFTALHFAVQSNRIDTIKILLNYGADVNLKLYPDCRHEIHNDSCKEEMFEDEKVCDECGYEEIAYNSNFYEEIDAIWEAVFIESIGSTTYDSIEYELKMCNFSCRFLAFPLK